MAYMERKIYNYKIIKYITIFETLTRVSVKDCYEEEGSVYFVVPEFMAAKAIGRGGINIKNLERAFNKRIRVVAFNKNVVKFLKNLLTPVRIKEIREEGKTITLVPEDSISRGKIIGRNASNLRKLERSLKRYFDIEEVKVVQNKR